VTLNQIDEPDAALRATIDPDHLAELAADLAAHGLLQPIGLRARPATDELTHDHQPETRYEIIYGHRRFLAARSLGWWDIAATIHPPTADWLTLAVAENLQRSDLTPVEEARAIKRLIDRPMTPRAIALALKRSDTWVAHRIALLDYPPDLIEAIHHRHLPLAVAALLAQITHDSYRATLTADALDNGATARTVAVWLQHYLTERPRIDANHDLVEQIAAERHTYVILAPCDYCGTKEDLTSTRSWRLCHTCTTGLIEAQRRATTTEAP
jgi:ParB family chromosome partitioning protein